VSNLASPDEHESSLCKEDIDTGAPIRASMSSEVVVKCSVAARVVLSELVWSSALRKGEQLTGTRVQGDITSTDNNSEEPAGGVESKATQILDIDKSNKDWSGI
jgi:hypothetical protein